MKIKERLAVEIEAAKKRSFTDQLREMELSKSYSKGETAYYQWRIDDLINEMTKKKGIADNWVLNGRFDINFKDWIEQFIEANLNEPEIWNEVQAFLRQYFRLIEYKEKLNKEYKVGKRDKLYTYLTDKKYIDTKIEVFNSVMEYKHLPGGANKIKWLTSQADAIYFGDINNFNMKQFNECFRSKNGNPFQSGSRSKTGRKPELTHVITFL